MSIVSFPGGKKDEEMKAGSQVLREFADLLEQFETGAEVHVEVAGVALVPDLGVALCGNSETGNDGLNTMLDLGKTAIIAQYLNDGEYEDEPPVVH